MKAVRTPMIAAVVTCTAAQNRSASRSHAGASSDKARLIGAWHLLKITGLNRKAVSTAPTGMLIYTRNRNMWVQLMYLQADNALSNEYVQSGF